MTTQDNATVEISDNAYWPNEAVLTDFAEQDVRVEQDARVEKDDRMKQANRSIENNPEYAALYFVS